jgi:hypothetical protein
MIRKSGHRFSEKIMLNYDCLGGGLRRPTLKQALTFADLFGGFPHLPLEKLIGLLGEILDLEVDRCAHWSSPLSMH